MTTLLAALFVAWLVTFIWTVVLENWCSSPSERTLRALVWIGLVFELAFIMLWAVSS